MSAVKKILNIACEATILSFMRNVIYQFQFNIFYLKKS